MVFSDTTNKNGLIQDVEFWLNVGDTGISGNATLLKIVTSNINRWYHKIVASILESQDAWEFDDLNLTDFPVATTPLVASQRDYSLPASLKVLKVKRVDITYDGTTYYRANPIDTGEPSFGLGNNTNTDGNFDKANPRYDLIGNSIWIYPLASATDVANGGLIRIEFMREVDEFTSADTTQEPGIDEPFHRMLSLGAALDYALTKNMPIAANLATLISDYEERLKRYYSRKEVDQINQLGAYLPKYD